MRYFWEFVEFIIMQQLDTLDSICRNYAIDCDYGGNRIVPTYESIYVGLGLGVLGFTVSTPPYVALGEILAELRTQGFDLHDAQLLSYIAQFYIYRSLKTGRNKTWKKRIPNTLLS